MKKLKSTGRLMEEMGFRQDAPENVKFAFLMNLIRAAEEQRRLSETTEAANRVPQQLQFDFEYLSEQSLANEDAKNKVG